MLRNGHEWAVLDHQDFAVRRSTILRLDFRRPFRHRSRHLLAVNDGSRRLLHAIGTERIGMCGSQRVGWSLPGLLEAAYRPFWV